ncbi:hypothetical protein LguiB_014161 [Lonicera macranthoides]
MSTKLFLVLLLCVVQLVTSIFIDDYPGDHPPHFGHKRPPIDRPPTPESRVCDPKHPVGPYPKQKPKLPLMAQGRPFAVDRRKSPPRFLPPRSPPHK